MARRGLRFTVSLGAKSSSNCRILLVEVDTSRAAKEIRCSHTGGDAWTYVDPAAGSAAGGSDASPPLKCNAWDRKGRNPAMNVYVHLASGGGATVPARDPGSGGTGASAATGCPPGEESESARCKLGILVTHALPKLAARLGGYEQLCLDWVTWRCEEGGGGAPAPASVVPLPGRQQDEAHWWQLRQLAKEKETGMGTADVSRSVQLDSIEEVALRRAKETLVEAARHFGPEAVAKVSRLTVRKLYQREYHFFDGDQDVADSRRHALEWAVGLAEVEEMLSTNAEARAKLNERLLPPGAVAMPTPAASLQLPSFSEVLAVPMGPPHEVHPFRTVQQPAADAAPQPASPPAAAAAAAGVAPAAAPAAAQAEPDPTTGSLPFSEWLQQLGTEPSFPPLSLIAAAPAGSPRGGHVQEAEQAGHPAAPAEGPHLQRSGSNGQQLGGGGAAQPLPRLHQSGSLSQLARVGSLAGRQAGPHTPALPPPAASLSPRAAPAGPPADADASGELVPLDAALEAWEQHDAVRRELREALARLEEQGRRLQGLEQEKEALQQALAAARSQRSSAAGTHGGSSGGSQGCSPLRPPYNSSASPLWIKPWASTPHSPQGPPPLLPQQARCRRGMPRPAPLRCRPSRGSSCRRFSAEGGARASSVTPHA